MDVPKVYYNENTIKSSKEFRTYYALEVVYHYNARLMCINAYFNYETVDMTWEMAMKIQECYKILVSCLYDFENEYTGKEAKIFSRCDQSSKETITIWKLALIEKPIFQMGGLDEETRAVGGKKCLPGKTLLPLGPSGLANQLFINFSSYFGGLGQTDNFEQNTKGLRIPTDKRVEQNVWSSNDP